MRRVRGTSAERVNSMNLSSLSQMAVGLLRAVGGAALRIFIPTNESVSEGVVDHVDSPAGPNLSTNEVIEVLQRDLHLHPEIGGLLDRRERGDSSAVADLGPAYVFLPVGPSVRASIAAVVSGALVREARYEEAHRIANIGISALNGRSADVRACPGIRCALLLNAAIAESHIPNKDNTLRLLAEVEWINPRLITLLYNRLCIAVRFDDQDLIDSAARALLAAHGSASNPYSAIGQSIRNDQALAAFRRSESYRRLFPAHARLGHGITEWSRSRKVRIAVRLILLAALALAAIILAGKARADMSSFSLLHGCD